MGHHVQKYNDTTKMLKFIPAYCLVKNTKVIGYTQYGSECVCVCMCMYNDQTDM